MFHYTAYGLNIQSALPLPELAKGGIGGDIRIDRASLGRVPDENAPIRVLNATSQEVQLVLGNVAIALVRNGCEILIDPAPGIEARSLRLFILGPVLSTLLCQRGYLVLHASAVTMNGGVVAFLGHKGWGKSTMAATLHARGYPLVTDDILAIDRDCSGQLWVRPGFPQLKLWPDAAKSIGEDPATLPQLHPQFTKRAHRATDGFSQTSFPLKRLYILGVGSALDVALIQPQTALLELVRHTYASALLGTDVIDSATHFRQCSQVVHHVPIYRLKRQHDLTALAKVADLVEQNDYKSEDVLGSTILETCVI